MDPFTEEVNTDFLYSNTTNNGYASTPQVSPTLLLAMSNETTDPQTLSNDMSMRGPAIVASERAALERNENIMLLKGAAVQLLSTGNIPAVEQSIQEIRDMDVAAKAASESPSFLDDTQVIAEAQLEKLMASSGLPRDKIISMAQQHSKNMAVRTAFEVAINSLSQRGPIAQFTQDMLGMTTAEDWAQLSPIVNEQLNQLGFQGPYALTFSQSVDNFKEVMRTIEPKDAGKILQHLSSKLVPVVGEQDTRRFFEAAYQTFAPNAEVEGIFGALDVLMIGGLLKGALKAVNIGSSAIKVARKTGQELVVATDLANKITNNISGLGASAREANAAASTVNILDNLKETGLASEIQNILRERTKTALDDVINTINTGGANSVELMASRARLENIYSTINNPSIISSSVSADINKGRLGIDVLYGDASGKAFKTAEEALNYYKNWKTGMLEVVPVGGKADDLKATIKLVDEKIATTIADIEKTKFHGQISTTTTVSDLLETSLFKETTKQIATEAVEQTTDKLPLYNYPKDAKSKGLRDALNGKSVLVTDVWNSVRNTATEAEQLVVDKIIKSLPKETKVVIKQRDGRDYYMGAADTIVLYTGGKNTNVFTHELIHAVTSNKIKYGLLTPSSEIGKIVSRMDNLRNVVKASIKNVTDTELKGYLEYLTKNTDEFSTAGLWSISNIPKVAQHLNNIPYKNTTLLSHIWETFKELLGIQKNDTALAEWFGLNEELTRQGLRVTLPETIQNGKQVTTILNRDRIYPASAPSKEVDVLMKDLESSVTDKLVATDALESPAEGFYVRQVADMPVFTADIGKITEDELNKMNLMLGKVNPRLASANSIYNPALATMYKTTRLNKIYSDFVKTSFDKLNKDSIDRINNALIKTESFKRDMIVLELSMEGVKSSDELEAYYAFRTMRNIEYYAKNNEAARSLTAQGFNNVFVGVGDLGNLSGPAKRISFSEHLGKKVFDVENNKFVTVTSENIKELETRGLQVYRYQKAQELTSHKGAITTIAVHPNKMRVGDITSVVGKVDGAFARIYTEEYFIKLNGKKLIDDTYEDTSYAFRTAINEKDAAKYVAGFNALMDMRRGITVVSETDVAKYLGAFEKNPKKLADDINAGSYDGAKATFNYNKIEDGFFRDVTGIGREDRGEGRLFWSGRSEEAIQSITTGSTDAITKGPLASLEAEISNTARFVSSSEFRRNAIQRWYNTFEDSISATDKLGAKSAEDVFFNVVNNVKGVAVGDVNAKRMLATKDFILSQLGAKTTDEKMMQHAINTLTGNLTIPGFSHVGAWLRKTDLVNWVKGVNSTLMLGLFSPAQLFVQASGFFLSASISPKHGLKAAFSVRPILIAMTSDNPSVWKWAFKAGDVAKNAGMKETEFMRVAAAIKKTGLLDNIGASSVYNGADGATNIFARNKNKFSQAQMMFFNKGEEINRVSAFDIARREFIEANPTVVWDTDEALSIIMLRADDLTMNMSRVNEARMSQGIFGVPLQFLQHNIRLGTNILAQANAIVGKKATTLSGKEALKLTLGSYLLYGINNNATPDFIEDWLGANLNSSLSEEQKQYLTQGVLAGVISTIGETITGERTNIALGTRLSSIQWYEDFGDAVVDLFKGNGADITKLAGPTGSSLIAALELPVIFRDYMSKDEWTLADFGRTVSTAGASLSSSWRNVDKAYWAYHANGMVYNKRGDAGAQLTSPELFFQALGFQSTEAYESGTVFKTKQEYTQTMQSYANTIIRYNVAARKAYLAGDIDSMNTNYRAASAILAPLPEADRKFIERLTKERTSYDTVGREAFNKWAAQNSSHKNKLLVTNPFGEQ